MFAPVSFMGGIAGQYFKQFGLTVAAAVLISLLVARLITPMLAAYFMRPHKHVEERDGFIMRFYTRLVGWSVRHKFVTFVLGLCFFAASIWSTNLLPSGFLPEEDISRSLFVMELPPGARLDDTKAETDRLTERLREMPEVRSVFVNGGTQLPAKKEVRLATLTVNFAPKEERSLRQRQLENRIIDLVQREIPDVRFFRLNENGQRGLSLIVAGPDQGVVVETAAKLRARDGEDPDPRKCRLDDRRSTGPRSASGRSRRSPPSSASRRTSSPRRCASARSATSARTSRSSTPATGRCRSVSSFPRARAPTAASSTS